jgi:predicted O-linked N-acetylglucosamine transferase (SPINDLY family)
MAYFMQNSGMASIIRETSGNQSPLNDACSDAMRLQLAGRLEHAEQLYRAILQAAPNHAAANYCLGMLNVQSRRTAEGLSFLLVALQANPQSPDYWLGYLEALLLSGRADEARVALALGRRHGLAGEAVEEFAARSGAPPDAHGAGDHESALLAMLQQGDSRAARALASNLAKRFPERGLSFKVLGALLWAEGSSTEALAAMQDSVRLLPRDAEAHCNLGLALAKANRFAEAEASLRKAIELDPKFATAHYRLGMTYSLQARLAEAEACLRRGIALRANYAEGDDAQNYSNLLFILSHNPAVDADSLFAEHCRFGEYFEDPVTWPTHLHGREPGRRLKVGFVSGDLREHAVASFIGPVLLQLRNRPGLEVHAYCNFTATDDVSERIRNTVRRWHPVAGLSDVQLADKIIGDGIDILIDLSGHTGLNRLPVFARKPAPIQASWIGYPGTTGLRAMDYYLADPHFLPPGEFDHHFTEKLVHIPMPFQPHEPSPPVNALPALAGGRMTFGSFSRPDKISASTLELWARLLRELPEATMLLGGIAFDFQRDDLIAGFAAHGVDRGRLVFYSHCAMDTYLELHHQVDLCLDTLPYNGGTTTLHALWMGVPTLTVAGRTPAGRCGAAILGQVGLREFITTGAHEFVASGVYWAQHLPALAKLRAELRVRWRDAPCGRPEIIGDGFEAALRRMWRRWCDGLPAESFGTTGSGLEGL